MYIILALMERSFKFCLNDIGLFLTHSGLIENGKFFWKSTFKFIYFSMSWKLKFFDAKRFSKQNLL